MVLYIEGTLYKRYRVGDFVDAKAPGFNKIQSTSTGTPQTTQQQSLRINKTIEFNKHRHLVRDQEVGGSNPLAPTTSKFLPIIGLQQLFC
jgi:hypothetical protein